MKFKATKKEMREGYYTIIQASNIDMLLRYNSPIAYSTRAEGWACDYYDIGGILISTGYAPLKGRGSKTNYEIETQYNNQARAIQENYDTTYEDRKEATQKLLREYVKEVTK